MGNPPRTRKRVQATRRAPDGSAFQNCSKCGVLVPIALEDMHECEVEKDVMIGKIGNETQIKSNQRFQHQPKSAFRFFMENFLKNSEVNDNQIEDDREGFNKWRKISEREKMQFVLQAEKVNSAYTKALLREAENMSSWGNDDEADSAEVGKYDENYKNCKFLGDSDDSQGFLDFWSNGSESLGNVDWELLRPYVIMRS